MSPRHGGVGLNTTKYKEIFLSDHLLSNKLRILFKVCEHKHLSLRNGTQHALRKQGFSVNIKKKNCKSFTNPNKKEIPSALNVITQLNGRYQSHRYGLEGACDTQVQRAVIYSMFDHQYECKKTPDSVEEESSSLLNLILLDCQVTFCKNKNNGGNSFYPQCFAIYMHFDNISSKKCAFYFHNLCSVNEYDL